MPTASIWNSARTRTLRASAIHDKVKDIRRRAIQAGLKLVDCPIRHHGHRKAPSGIYACASSAISRDERRGAALRLRAASIILAQGRDLSRRASVSNGTRGARDRSRRARSSPPGRRGADWLETLCAEHGIAHQPGTVDIGVRVEVRNEIMETVNEVLYESKLIGYPEPFKNKVRTFCQNPGGFVSARRITTTVSPS